ncbi:MAG: hypothetical protein R3310_14765, partial [Candidatus Competibacteraceae bacterium]|nr:hypothetical protein [Candidatus Competibacteraceae bacterium]
MNPELLELLRCPRSGERLQPRGEEALVNESGTQTWPVVLGIPDFRLFDPPYMTREDEKQLVQELWQVAQRTDYDGLLRYYETHNPGGRSRA